MRGIVYAGVCLSSVGALYAAETLLPADYETNDHAYEPVVHIVKTPKKTGEWRIGGDIRAGALYYDYGNDPYRPDPTRSRGHLDSKGIYLVPKLSLRSPRYGGLEGKLTVAGATDFGINDPAYETRTFVFDPKERTSFVILQEAYLSYTSSNERHRVVVGAKETVTPMIDADDWYMLANSFQGAYYRYKHSEHMTAAVGYFAKMAGVWDSGANGTEWHSMAEASFAYGNLTAEEQRRVKDNGVWTAALDYNDKTHHLQVWDYYAEDLYNTLFVQYDYSGAYGSVTYDAGVQYIDFQEVGVYKDNPSHTIDYHIASLRFNASFGNGWDTALGAAFYSDGEGTGATLGAWGGYPYFANGMIFHFFEAGSLRNADSYKVQIGYTPVEGLWIGARFTLFDLDPTYSTSLSGTPQDTMRLYGVKMSYDAKNGIYVTGTFESVDLDGEPRTYAVRLIGGYKF